MKLNQKINVEKVIQESDINGIGLVNINERIKLVFGMEYGLKITSDSKGTLVIIELPV